MDAYLYTIKPLGTVDNRNQDGPGPGHPDTLSEIAGVYPKTPGGLSALWEALWTDCEENLVTLKGVNDDTGEKLSEEERVANLESCRQQLQRDPLALNRYLVDGAIHRISIIPEPFDDAAGIDSLVD